MDKKVVIKTPEGEEIRCEGLVFVAFDTEKTDNKGNVTEVNDGGVSGVVGSLSQHQLLTALHLCANVLKDALHRCNEAE